MAEAAGVHENKEHTMTKAELVEEVTRVTELTRKESEAVVETIFDSIIAALQADDKIEILGLWKLSDASTARSDGPKSKNGRESGSAAKENSLLQAQQRAERLREPPASCGLV